jgi:hypothetical protein
MTGFKIGADPEIFVRKGGKAVAAYGLIEGTKASPKATARGAVQVDGLALEFNINPTDQNDFEGFNQNIVTTMRDLKEMVPGYTFNIEPTQDFDPEYLSSLPPEALELGCDPDYDAYTRLPNPRPDGEKMFRTGAGHIHLGWGADIPADNEDHIEICAEFIKVLDWTVGMYMTVIDRDPRRRELYGKAGAFRPKSYGVEYRTPSNVWITNRHRRELMHRLINKAIAFHMNGYLPEKQIGYTQDQVREIINSGDATAAISAMNNLTRYDRQILGLWVKVQKELEAADAKAQSLTQEDASILEKVREA